MNVPSVQLRRGGPDDLAAVMDVMKDSFDPRFGEAWNRSQCAGILPMPGVWLTIAEDERGVAGFAMARQVADEAELLLLAVRSNLQGRGIGSKLLDSFSADAARRSVRHLHLEVRDGNPAIQLYVRAGYSLVGRRPDYYNGPDGNSYDALTLARNIDA